MTRLESPTRLTRLWKQTSLLLLILTTLTSLHCGSQTTAVSNGNSPIIKSSRKFGYQIVNIFPHDPSAFTQGLEFHDGKLLESTGEEGSSSLRSVELETGKVDKKVDVPSPYFAEGVTRLNGKIYQLTWQHQLGFIYDASSLEKVGQFTYYGEGWGLTNDGHSLIMSDGSNRIRFLSPDTFQVTNTIAVMDGPNPVNELNELEYIKGEIYANVWHDNRIATIDAQTGQVTGWIDLNGILPPNSVSSEEAVLNGIAFDESTGRLFITGKLWPHLFEIRLRQQ